MIEVVVYALLIIGYVGAAITWLMQPTYHKA